MILFQNQYNFDNLLEINTRLNELDNIDAKIELILLLVKNKQFTEAENLLKKIDNVCR